MVAFKEEFPYLRADSGQLFEFDRDWLHAAINRAADQAGYPSWWLTDHVTESIAFYLHLRNDENGVAFAQLGKPFSTFSEPLVTRKSFRISRPRRRLFRFRWSTLLMRPAAGTS